MNSTGSTESKTNHVLELTPAAERDLAKFPRDAYAIAREGIDELRRDMHPRRSEKLAGRPGYRWKKRNVRILYVVSGDRLLLIVVPISDRKEAYGKRAQRRF